MARDDLEVLGLDGGVVERVATASEGYGRLLIDTDEPEPALLAGSCYSVAGSAWSLLEPRRARAAFSKAADAYRRGGSEYYAVVAVCGGEIDLLAQSIEGRVERHRSTTNADVLYYDIMVAASVSTSVDSNGAEQLLGVVLDQPEVSFAQPVGRLHLPLRLFASVLQMGSRFRRVTSDSAQGDGIDALASSFREFAARVDEVTAAAMSDSFHWRRLQSAVLPVEPEALALGVLAVRAVNRLTPRPLEEIVELPSRQRALARIALQMSTW